MKHILFASLLCAAGALAQTPAGQTPTGQTPAKAADTKAPATKSATPAASAAKSAAPAAAKSATPAAPAAAKSAAPAAAKSAAPTAAKSAAPTAAKSAAPAAAKSAAPATAAKSAPAAAKSATPAKSAVPAAAGAAAAGAAAAAAGAAKAPATAAKSAGPRVNIMDPATTKSRAPEVYQVKVNTTKGAFTIEVTRAWAPNGADRFYNLVRGGFYNEAGFFRVVPNFMVQFGISSKPEVSRIWAQNNMPDDLVKQSNKRGFITYAQTSAPNSRSTQLFINFKDNSFLDGQRFAPFGQVVEGMDIVDSIYSGYGENPDQGRLTAEGKAYTDRNYPRMDRILTATIVPPAPAAPAADTKAAPKAADTK